MNFIRVGTLGLLTKKIGVSPKIIRILLIYTDDVY